jgi:drug/metabolite transporter (DMT)-like permease
MKGHPFLPLVLIVGVVSISTAALFIKLALADAAPVAIAAARMGIAAMVLAPLTIAIRGRRAVRIPPHCRLPILLAGLFLGAHFYFWTASLKETSVLSSVVIVTTNPIFVGIASFLFFREPLRRSLIIGILLAAAGGAVIAITDAGHSPGTVRGNLLALAGAVMASCYLLMGRRVRREVDILSYILPVYAIAAALLIGLALFLGKDVRGYRPSTYAYFVLLAIVPQLIGHSCLNWALAHASATMVAVCILGEPVGASLIALVVLKEVISGWQAAGAALILTGIFICTREPSGKTTDAVARSSSARSF